MKGFNQHFLIQQWSKEFFTRNLCMCVIWKISHELLQTICQEKEDPKVVKLIIS